MIVVGGAGIGAEFGAHFGAMTLRLGAGPCTVVAASGSARITEGSLDLIDGFRSGFDRIALLGVVNPGHVQSVGA